MSRTFQSVPRVVGEIGETKIVSVDKPSVEGKFGWKAIGDQKIPFIARGVDKVEYFVATRFINITKYLKSLHLDIFRKCLSIKSFFITNYEADHLNLINAAHCDFTYGEELFYSRSDFIVRLEDVIELYTFLECCTNKLKNSSSKTLTNNDRFGFIRIYLESHRNDYVPFIKIDGQICIPLFFFEGQIEKLNNNTFKLEGWDLAYLKLCCIVQGIKAKFYDVDACDVIKLDNIISYFEPETNFEEYWPSETIMESKLWRFPNEELLPISTDVWFKKPHQMDSKKSQQKLNTSPTLQIINPLPGIDRISLSNIPQSKLKILKAVPPILNTNVTSQTTGLQLVEPLTSVSNTPLILETIEQQIVKPMPSNTSITSQTTGLQVLNSSPQQLSNTPLILPTTVLQMEEPLPQLPTISNKTLNLTFQNLPNKQKRGSSSDVDDLFKVDGTHSSNKKQMTHNNYATVKSDCTSLETQHTLPHFNLLNTNCMPPQLSVVDSVSPNILECNINRAKTPEFKIVKTLSDGATRMKDISVVELIRIQDRNWQLPSPKLAYEVISFILRGNTIFCINKMPYEYSDCLITLKDVVKLVIPFCSIQICGLIFQNKLHKTLYCGNTEQISLLYRNGVADTQIPIDTPLVSLSDVTDNLDDLEIMAHLYYDK